MRNLPSLTAEAVCMARALECRHPVHIRLLDDPFADGFLRRPQRLGRSAIQRTPGHRALDPGLVAAISARHSWIDERLLASLHDVQQVVIVGAGYDARAWRFAHELAGRPVFEVDHPATAARKARCVRRQAHRLPQTTWTQVPTDLRHERLDDALANAGVAADVPTTFIWEGVSMYLTERQVRDTIQRMRASCGPGSHLIMDLWQPTLGISINALGERLGRVALGMLGEPLKFTLTPHQVPELLHPLRAQVQQQDTVQGIAMRRSGRRAFPALHMVHARFDG